MTSLGARECAAEYCSRPVRSTGAQYCEAHYCRIRNNSPLGLTPINEACVYCGEKFKKKSIKFCSQQCRTRHRRGVPIGKTFKPFPNIVILDNPQWKQIAGFSSYEISNDGRLRRLTKGSNSHAGQILRGKISDTGYLTYGLSDAGGHRKHHSAHHLVARAFLPEPAELGLWVLHKDDNKLNITAENLKWGTQKENTDDARTNGRLHLGENHPCRRSPWTRPRGAASARSKLTDEDVIKILSDTRRDRDIASSYGVDPALIRRMKKGKVWKHITQPGYAEFLANGRASAMTVSRKRKKLSRKHLRELLDRENRTCHICNTSIKPGEAWDVSHEIPLALGGDDSVENRRAAHRKCHRHQTATVDIPAIAKAKRLNDRHIGIKPSSSRPMPFGITSKWKKKLNGKIVER